MIEPLDDFYTLDTQNQRAFNGLVELPEIQEELLWTALPTWRLRFNDVLGICIGLPLLFLTGLFILLSSLTTFLLLALLMGAALIAILIDFWQEERKRRHTFYGISTTAIWIKVYNLPLQQIFITDLHRLSHKNGNIISAAIINNTYEEQLLLEHVPEPTQVVTLLQHLQQHS